MLSGLIFDMDGTLTMTESLHNKAFATVFKEYGVDFPFSEQVEKYAGSGSLNIFTKVFADRGIKVSEEEIGKCMAKKKELYTKIVQETEIPVVEGAKEFVERTEKWGLKRIIATGNSNLDVVRFILEKVGLSGFFPELLSITEVSRGKPFPDIFLEAARRMGLAPLQCVVFEDSINGVAAAAAAGIRCIALETTTKKRNLIAAGASITVKNYFEITNKILYGE